MTMPAIAPPESPLFVAVAAMPCVEPRLVGAEKATVVVGVPVEVTVLTPLLVGRRNAEPVFWIELK